MKKICDIMEIILRLKEEDNLYNQKKDIAIEDTDIERVKTEKLNDLQTKHKLSSIKVNVLSDMNNLLNMIQRDFA